MSRFKKKLIEQISFLQSSCEMYDKGHTHEALRIALSLRVIFYSSGSCTSIMKHLGVTDIKLLSTGGIPKESAKDVIQFHGLGMYELTNTGDSRYRPSLGDGPPLNKLLPLKQWWQECVYVLEKGKLITRFIIMDAAANNDGGAHVDERLEPLYASLSEDGALGAFESINEHFEVISRTEITNANHVALRQMAYEVLHSPEFMQLAK
ncbi:hypothetical protein H0O82_06965 [Escherichia coli]|uniref:hypothetical protein n=1 Tax=Citrobacter portucalensis TaxID=1639133 RepID=UPI0015E1FE93|nr:hypothetical protein [Citrobacter portucalensis]MBA0943608.1 hypothetical protein [Escherichia coli]MBJ9284797.1 hypothetical protein [Citrobacter freundii]MEB1112124.1 hypothetical protein [Citrobacter portucalensis]HCB1649756.1 hypothetical protein [Citrobacter freundii]HCO5287428.1 hypothetical protein [Escherichia coli]